MEDEYAVESETLDVETLSLETQPGGVKHNRDMGLGSVGQETDDLPFEQETEHPEATEPAATMANDPLNQNSAFPTSAGPTDGSELDLNFSFPVEEKPIWVDLYGDLRDFFFPPKLPPLELTSKPIPVPDRMAVKPNPWAIGISSGINIAILLIALFFVGRKIVETIKPPLNATPIDVEAWKGPQADKAAGGGGGGGDHSAVDASKGKLPKIEKNPVEPPQVQALDKPKLAMEAAINVQNDLKLPDNPTMPNIGVKNSANVKLASNGQGGGSGIGTGYGGGIGSGSGNGYGPGSGGNTGGGLYRIGGGVSAPVVLYQVDAEFSDEARRNKYQGICLVEVTVDAQGNPQDPRVPRPLGMGLDENAIKAIMQFKFKPAMFNGKPVPSRIGVQVNFRIY
jgi:TonB family protein